MTLEDTYGNATTKASATTVNLTSNSTGTHQFAATSAGTAVTSVTLPANTASVSAYYGDEKPGTPTITAAATGLNSATQQETITAGAPSKLVFTTSPVSGAASNSATLGPITVQQEDAYGNVATSGSPSTVNLNSTSAGASFADHFGGAAITAVTIPGGYSTATFYYGDTKAGTPTITAAASGMTSATQQETISALAGTKLGVSTFSGTASASATNAFTVTLEDVYGNATTNAERDHGELDLELDGHPRVRCHLGRGGRDQRHPAGQHRRGHRLLRRRDGRDAHHYGHERHDLRHGDRDQHGQDDR